MKKNKKNIKTETELNTADTTSHIGYTGTVNIKFVKNNRVINSRTIKNMGTIYFFKGLCSFIAANDINFLQQFIPHYICADADDPTTADGSTEKTWNSSTTGFDKPVGLSKITQQIVSNNSVSLTALIPGTAIINKTLKKFGLFGSDDTSNTLLAFIDAKDSTGKFIEITDQSINLFVEWTINIDNK